MHHLIADIGWPTLVLAALLLAACAPPTAAWIRFELRLAKRARQLPRRARQGWPYW